MVYDYNLNTQAAEGRVLWVQDQPELQNRTLEVGRRTEGGKWEVRKCKGSVFVACTGIGVWNVGLSRGPNVIRNMETLGV